ncbi:MAG: Rrf2 family transcriptional regulator [Planctomycetota bacterium]
MLSQTAEYALRAVSALAPCGSKLVPTTELAELADVPPPYLAKVLQQLAAADIIRGRRGVGGGYTLKRDATEISLLEVVLAVGPIREPRTQAEIETKTDGLNALHGVIDASAAHLRTSLERTSVADVAQDVGARRQSQAAQPAQPAAASNGQSNGFSNGRSNGFSNGHGNGQSNGSRASFSNA